LPIFYIYSKKPKPEKPIRPWDAEIYRLYTEEMHTIPALVKEFRLARKEPFGDMYSSEEEVIHWI